MLVEDCGIPIAKCDIPIAKCNHGLQPHFITDEKLGIEATAKHLFDKFMDAPDGTSEGLVP